MLISNKKWTPSFERRVKEAGWEARNDETDLAPLYMFAYYAIRKGLEVELHAIDSHLYTTRYDHGSSLFSILLGKHCTPSVPN